MNDEQLTDWLRRAEVDAPFPAEEHAQRRDEVLAHFDRATADQLPESPVADGPDGADRGLELGPGEAPRRRRLTPMLTVAAGALLIVGAFAAWAPLGGDDDQPATTDGPPTSTDLATAPFGPIGTTLVYDVARDGVPQGTLDLTVVGNETPADDRQETTLAVGFRGVDVDEPRQLGDVRFEITPDTWTLPISLGRLGGVGWPDCGDAAAGASRITGETVEQSIDCDGRTAALVATSERLGDRLDVQISLQTPDGVHELRAIGNADGRLDRMIVQLSTTVELREIRIPASTDPEGST